jgi:hypothetical protein
MGGIAGRRVQRHRLRGDLDAAQRRHAAVDGQREPVAKVRLRAALDAHRVSVDDFVDEDHRARVRQHALDRHGRDHAPTSTRRAWPSR